MTKEDAASDGIERAWDFWLSQHPISVPEIIQEAVEKVVRRWLDDHSDEIIAAVADCPECKRRP